MSNHCHTESKGCRQWLRAQQSGTDNEMYGRLLRIMDGDALIGCDLDPIEYCPWCGTPLKDDQPPVT